MAKKAHRKKRSAAPVWPVSAAILLGTAAATGLLLLFAFFIYREWLPESAVPTVNTIIKVLAAVLCGLWVGSRVSENAWLFGGVAGLGFTVLSTLLFSLFAGSFSLGLPVAADALLSFALGAAAAGIAAYLKERRAARPAA